jgi:hypothetical protein
MDIFTKRIRSIMKAAYLCGFKFYDDENVLAGRNYRNDMIVITPGRMIMFRNVAELDEVR